MLNVAIVATFVFSAPFSLYASEQERIVNENAKKAEIANIARKQAEEALAKLFKDSDEAHLKLNPFMEMARGGQRYADRFGDYLSDAYAEASRKNLVDSLKRLEGIDRKALSPKSRIAYDVFKYTQSMDLKIYHGKLLDIGFAMPVDQFNGLHVQYVDIASGNSIAQFRTVDDYINNLRRFDGFVKFMNDSILRMRTGIKRKQTLPKIVAKRVIEQLERIMDMPDSENPYLNPLNIFPRHFDEKTKAELSTQYHAVLHHKILPAYKRLHHFMKKEYLPHTRKVPGLVSMKNGGSDYYRHMVKHHTTTNLTPEEIHQIGLDEVKRIAKEMNAAKEQAGFKGSLKKFFKYLKTDPQFKFQTKQDLLNSYAKVRVKLKDTLPRLFAIKPKSPLEIRAVPSFMEQNQASAYYNSGTPDGSRPGVFYVNTYSLPERTSPGVETLYLHEAEPGHHFQISLAQENTELPNFMRFDGNTAFVEGWALYSETLGKELGLYTDPIQYFGHLDDQMLRAMRLVVDTGLHAKGWSRRKAIKYFLKNSSQSATDSRSEIERYIAFPGQALAYKIGQLTIRQLRNKAEKALGDRFDIRAFHKLVLEDGALPLTILEKKVDNWIEYRSNLKPPAESRP